MKIDPAVAREHDEIVTVTSSKGDVATYKINALTKSVHIKTLPGDGNEQEFRHCNASYDAIAAMVGKNSQGEPVPSEAAKPIESVPVFGTPAADEEEV